MEEKKTNFSGESVYFLYKNLVLLVAKLYSHDHSILIEK